MTDPSKSSPKHGSSPSATEAQPSVSQADGTAANAPRGETHPQPGNKEVKIKSETSEVREGKINPSAPNDATSRMPANTTRDSAGEIGEPSGEGTLDAPKANEGTDGKKEKNEEAA